MRYKYPRTYHLPFSEGCTSDDKKLLTDAHFDKVEVVVTEKMDGENITIYRDGFHARSLDSKHKEYHSWLIREMQKFAYNIPEGYRICGEYLFARHSIPYDSLPSYFLVFSVWDGDTCLSWDDTEIICEELGLQTVPVLWRTQYNTTEIKALAEKVTARGGEGIVVRYAGEFKYDEFDKNLAKYVRKNHVQTDKHWSFSEIVKNAIPSFVSLPIWVQQCSTRMRSSR